MVLARMGMLDDAIREHLELKRRRGADPGEVAREQREVLDAVGSDVPPQDEVYAESPPVSGAPLVDRPDEALADGGIADPGKPAEPSAANARADETAELDMASVLGDDAGSAASGVPGAETTEGESLEWEMPTDSAAREAAVEEPDEDVLEETPDFLRETPEQERLWFEQRPPRDFDFDK
jgi:hypothetical protein